MTVASNLFFQSRPRFSGRTATSNSDPDPDPDPADLLDHRYPRNDRHRRRRRHQQQPSELHGGVHRIPRLEHESVRLERINSGKIDTGGKSSTGVSINGVRRSKLIKNIQLPDAVMQARARLLERLRGLSLEESRQSTTVASISWDDYVVSNYSTNADNFEGLEIETLLEPNTPQSHSSLQQPKKKLSSLCWESLYTRKRQVFSDSEESEDNEELSECYICLESFREGDVLIRLHCRHRFHSSCLQPWIQICGDCPCCRADVC